MATPAILMERFLIVQLDMLTQNWNDDQDDQKLLESAVLYSFCSQHPTNHHHHLNPPTPSSHAIIDDSLRLFLGLCTALYTLPNEIQKASESVTMMNLTKQQRQMVVQLTSSTRLIFLEIETNILAVAQVSFHSHSTRISNIAVQDSIKHAHRYFCLLRGGSIRRRLSGSTLQVQHHEQKKRMMLENTVEQQLQNDLRIHLDSYMAVVLEEESICSWVLAVPSPIPLLSHTHEWYVAPVTSISKVTQTHIQMTLNEILQLRYPKNGEGDDDIGRDDSFGGQVLGIATFAQGQLQHVITPSSNENDERNHVDISNETAILLMRYMSQFQYQLSQVHTDNDEIGRGIQSFTPTSSHRRPPFASLDEPLPVIPSSVPVLPTPSATSISKTTASHHHHNNHNNNGFLTSPPLSLLSALDESKNHEFVIQSDTGEDGGDSFSQKVWAPLVFLPYRRRRKTDLDSEAYDLETAPAAADVDKEDYWNARVALYSCGDFSFLLFVNCKTDSLDEHEYDDTLWLSTLFRDINTQFLKLMRHLDLDSSDHEEIIRNRVWRKPGQTIVSMNQTNQNLTIFPDPAKNLDEDFKSPSSTKTAGKRGPADFVGLFSPKNQQQLHEQHLIQNASVYRSITTSVLAPDCRHLLLSQLSSDCLWALQDVMEEVRHMRRPLDNDDGLQNETNDSWPFELCSLLRNDWIYCWANHHVDLYVILDAAYYVTVADVHRAVLDIRYELLVDEQAPIC